MLAKCEEYHVWGGPVCWVIDPVTHIAWEYQADGEALRIDDWGLLRAGEITVDMRDLFKENIQSV